MSRDSLGRPIKGSTDCAMCGRDAEPVRGQILERLYPNRTSCTGCGRIQLYCSCKR